MPSSTNLAFPLGIIFFIAGFGLIFQWIPVAIVGGVGIAIGLYLRSFDYDNGYYIDVEEIKKRQKKSSIER
ncbi:hypothetical protein GCM10020331_082530 [Ectobacillus funiculus]